MDLTVNIVQYSSKYHLGWNIGVSFEYRVEETSWSHMLWTLVVLSFVQRQIKFSRVVFAGTDPRNVSVSIPSPNGDTSPQNPKNSLSRSKNSVWEGIFSIVRRIARWLLELSLSGTNGLHARAHAQNKLDSLHKSVFLARNTCSHTLYAHLCVLKSCLLGAKQSCNWCKNINLPK